MTIGIFDSGVGGLTVVRQIIHTLPHESIIYFGDTARLPYGTKSRDTVVQYALENASFLVDMGIKMLVIACNTASVHALETLQNTLSIPVIGVVEPGVEEVASVSQKSRIAILGTRSTIRSGVYQKKIENSLPHAQITSIACPLFVPLVEEDFLLHPSAKMIVEEYLKPLRLKPVDTILLGCTHYPLLTDLIQEVVGEKVTIVDSATACAKKVANTLEQLNLIALPDCVPSYQYFVSDDPDKFEADGQRLLNLAISCSLAPCCESGILA